MNEFEERMARITERSRQILIARKKMRIRIAALCIPLLLCGTMVIFLLPDNNTSQVSIPQTSANMPTTQIVNNSILIFQTEAGNKTVSDSEAIREFAELLDSFYSSDQLEMVVPEDDGVCGDVGIGSSSLKETLTIIITDEGCDQKTYTLTDNILKCQENDQTVVLNKEQTEEIRRYIP